MKYKDFFIDTDDRYFIDATQVKREEFNERREYECSHRWIAMGASARDGECKDCHLQVVNGNKVRE